MSTVPINFQQEILMCLGGKTRKLSLLSNIFFHKIEMNWRKGLPEINGMTSASLSADYQ